MLDTGEVLRYLECSAGPLGIRHLNRLIRSYVRKVPWESVTRIVQHASLEPALCPRWPEAFWHDAIRHGTGGTCFESNYAFSQLLQQLGYTGYLTINDMGTQRGCHSAILLHLDRRKLLVDIAIPLLVTLQIDPTRITRRSTWLHSYTVQPDGADRYQILRSRHPKRNIYTLLDTPVPEAGYRQVVARDYEQTGLFLDRVIIVKIIGERLWRFSSADQPFRLESFGQHDRQEIEVPSEHAAAILSEHFGMPEERIAAALQAVNRRSRFPV